MGCGKCTMKEKCVISPECAPALFAEEHSDWSAAQHKKLAREWQHTKVECERRGEVKFTRESERELEEE